jgi:glycosyltransferase involved in cell wall biosynthesis
VILSFRAATPLYNLDVAVDAFRTIRASVPDATLVLAHGDAPLAATVHAALKAAGGGVRVVGNVAHGDMPRFLRAATVGVSIPSSDGSPSSVWEALACGLPVVASDLPQITERLDGSKGVRLVGPRRDAVAAALLDVVTDPALRADMAAAGRAWALENVDARKQIEALGRVYATTTPAPGTPAGSPASRSR